MGFIYSIKLHYGEDYFLTKKHPTVLNVAGKAPADHSYIAPNHPSVIRVKKYLNKQKSIPLKVSLVAGAHIPYIRWINKNSWFKIHSAKSYSIAVDGYLKVFKSEINNLVIQLDYIDDSQQVFWTEEIKLSKNGQVNYRPGDLIDLRHVIAQQVDLIPNIQMVKIHIVKLKKFEAVKEYCPSHQIVMDWGFMPQKNMAVEIRERQSEFSYSETYQKYFHKLTYEFENKGKLPLGLLKLQIQWFDQYNKLLGMSDTFALSNTNALLYPNQTFIRQGTFGFKASANKKIHYKILIIEAEKGESI